VITPAVLSAFTTAIAAPSVDSLSERFAATFVLLRRFSMLNQNLHLLQLVLAVHHSCTSIVLNLFTSAAVIVAICVVFIVSKIPI
jgi:hypothetical protein